VLRLGYPPASKVLAQWVVASGARQVQVHGNDRWIDPDHASAHVVADPAVLCRALAPLVQGASGTPWLARWRHADERAQAALSAACAGDQAASEPAVARALGAALPDGAALVVSSSMPVRDLEWYLAPRHGLTVHANRGANGIDGVVSTAVGVALARGSAQPTALLIGDLAFLHDANGLLALRGRDVDLTIVVVDNRGGAIFSFLPQRTLLDVERFEQLFGTPTGTDPVAVAAAHGLPVTEVASAPELHDAVACGAGSGARVLVVRSDRDANVAAHDALHRAVAAAL
jgi:2-succinyl-5-enolpyruvyl-6-hydroxy-3-cyclohexene-1-carboxylate synthase